eukprot:6414711-Pyramimonas_sp.AAC.1
MRDLGCAALRDRGAAKSKHAGVQDRTGRTTVGPHRKSFWPKVTRTSSRGDCAVVRDRPQLLTRWRSVDRGCPVGCAEP